MLVAHASAIDGIVIHIQKRWAQLHSKKLLLSVLHVNNDELVISKNWHALQSVEEMDSDVAPPIYNMDPNVFDMPFKGSLHCEVRLIIVALRLLQVSGTVSSVFNDSTSLTILLD